MVTPVFAPFIVLFLGEGHTIKKYQPWIDAHTFPLTVVSHSGGVISYDDFDIGALQSAFLNICETLKGQVKEEALALAHGHIKSWRVPEERPLGYQVGGHNSVRPNLMALHAAGFRDTTYGPFKDIKAGQGPYVDQIAKTARTILDERESVGEREPNRYVRRPPSLNCFVPAIYPHIGDIPMAAAPFSPDEKRRFLAVRRALQRQEGYMFDTATEAQARALFGDAYNEAPHLHPIMQLRAGELNLATECVCTLSSSEISAVLRLPNAVNKTAGQVRQFVQQYHARQSNDRKRRVGFDRVQEAITKSFPEDFIDFVCEASDGVRLISDAHLEWLRIRDLPLCVQKDVTRIPVTPGNLFIEQVSPKPYLNLNPSDFDEILVLSALEEDDPISRFFDIAIQGYEPEFKNRIRVRTERVRNAANLVEILNSFEGAMMIFDGHGGHHPGRPATLKLLEEDIDVWQLQSLRPRVPPIVVLSACDTHAADRNHASTANGFLAIGARTVLGSVFPIDAREAASFIGRLLYRVAEFVPAAHSMFHRSLSWMEIMGGMIRMQLLTDFCMRLERKRMIDHAAYRDVHLAGNMAINSLDDWPFEAVISELKKIGIEEKAAWRELHAATANSTAISYLQLGRPETIMVHSLEDYPKDS
jgi:hypothetical protein